MLSIRSTVLLTALTSVHVFAQSQPEVGCEGTDHISEVRCLGKEIDQLNKELDSVYRQALDTRPDKDGWDSRKNREQLRKSQLTWSKFKDENCALIGGLEGGGNLWVTDFAAQCEKDEIRKRIEFLKQVANGKFGG